MTRIPHNGGPCPVDPETMVEIELRCGEVNQDRAFSYVWQHLTIEDADYDIIAYRVITPSPDWKAIAGELAEAIEAYENATPRHDWFRALDDALAAYTQAMEQDQ